MQCVWGFQGKMFVFIMFTKSQIAGVNFFVNLVDLDVWLNIWYMRSNILLHTLYFFVISSMVIPIPLSFSGVDGFLFYGFSYWFPHSLCSSCEVFYC